jgi:selenocysteine lyase/cysteine desulfurase
MTLEAYFHPFRERIIGINTTVRVPDGRERPLVYADWIASGRLYAPIEEYLQHEVGPYVANTHTETTITGTAMTRAYHDARAVIKEHVHADENDLLFLTGYGMTSAVNKLQRILGLRVPERLKDTLPERERPMVLITHMEHHSNQITWEECDVDLRIVPHEPDTGLPDLDELEKMAQKYSSRPLLIGAFTSGSNVTGILTPYHRMASVMHRHGGLCFVDFAASAPYIDINIHPEDPQEHLDAVMFSPHKFLGGPGTSGILIMNRGLYHNTVPDNPGGGTVRWTNPFGRHLYIEDIEAREDGGTPGFLQAVRTALTLRLKEAMGTEQIREREEELMKILWEQLEPQKELLILEQHNRRRLGIISFFTPVVHHNLFVRLLNDRFAVQTRGGCSCAGTYGHILFHINKLSSSKIEEMITRGDLSEKPGWVRISVHPTMTDEEARYIADAVKQILQHGARWGEDYRFDKNSGDFIRVRGSSPEVPELLKGFSPLP